MANEFDTGIALALDTRAEMCLGEGNKRDERRNVAATLGWRSCVARTPVIITGKATERQLGSPWRPAPHVAVLSETTTTEKEIDWRQLKKFAKNGVEVEAVKPLLLDEV